MTTKDDIQENLLSREEFSNFAKLVEQWTGIHLDASKRAMVSGRLKRLMRSDNFISFQSYYSDLSKEKTPTSEKALNFISSITTNMTKFQREPHHFIHLETKFLPKQIKLAKKGKKIRLWSAACSTGEEAYDIAFKLLHLCPNANELDIKILATDIDKRALHIAKQGQYENDQLSELSQTLRTTMFLPSTRTNEVRSVVPQARSLIQFRWLNLNETWPFHGKFDAIFCRNVAIYFDKETSDKLWTKLIDRVNQNGYLYIGHSESLPREKSQKTLAIGKGVYEIV